MVDVNKAVIARLTKNGKTFEVLVDCDKALAFKEGKAELDEALATDDIFSDVKQDEKPSEEDLEDVFKTLDMKEIATAILKQGKIQLTTEHKNKLREELRKKLIEMIRKNSVDSRTNLPHPRERIERAFEEKRVKIDEFKTAEQQMKDIAKQINDLLPLKFEVREISIKISSEFAGKAFGNLKQLAKVLSNDWLGDGSLLVKVEIPAGMQPDLEDQLNKLTHGNVEIKVINAR
ncbi:MAG: ribosome assembly factor SBDS [Nanoarchaeota archaeon]|nr:ribosome assembly factor SBDS [Nanoarchaeota archaeon]MBU4241835.1 ribosome assembly factor SBDS [Nanoarchaeota archaeon]MBU4352412.1 ribosome assembly factor SBDS [Nanoarchaeota archaeon]MBU4456061.1 ribosome assembly factor SBDS [Nanoarchaeota archaeon]MCG2720294.1 ribosome assembly factor SBDS [Nanoarchaeota archaeon]